MPSSVINSDDGVISGTSGIKTTGGDDGVLNIQSNGSTVVAVAGSGVSVTGTLSSSGGYGAVSATTLTVNSNNISADNSLGFRNRIINGDMRIDQRNAGAGVNLASATYVMDRWTGTNINAAAGVLVANRQSITDLAGFSFAYNVNVTTAETSPAANYGANLNQNIEGFNVADLGWGTASAKPITLSFWVYSAVTGTLSGGVSNSAANRAYVFTYSVSSANTWEYKTVTIPGETTGTWVTDNGIGMRVLFDLGAGSDREDTPGSWVTSNKYRATGAQRIVAATGNPRFRITGVQLEVGSVATPFERRPYGTELALCQRYYCKTFDIGVAPGNNVAGAGELLATNINQATYEPGAIWRFPVAMRAVPTITMFNPAAGTAGQWYDGANSTANARAFNPGNSGVWFDNSGSAVGGSRYRIQAVASIEL